ncbi:hypothetical protein B0H94_10328 [Salsuginibacillus halophilus]|uniref:Uncharacterized protein n=1 Tax=Salsuginibacillus halophilus TaxID=517424 RepID=A0A2P8HW03_9BACI|nr:hypothetical protein [Salsuginibacillus halophilus]PSL50417.1 hypothetical protein B0H94_10328 [Salsuginibacillus halophilus]
MQDTKQIDMNDKTRAWIMKRGGIVTIDPYQPGTGIVNQTAFDTRSSLEQPADPSFYECHHFHGTLVYVHQGVRQKNKPIKLSIAGASPFEHLHVRGVKRFKAS